MALTFAESWIEEGIAKGEAKAIVFILKSRFGAVPARLARKVLDMGDLEQIEKAMELAMNCRDVKAFQKGL